MGFSDKPDPRGTGMGQRLGAAMAVKLDASVERDPSRKGTRCVVRFARVTPAPAKSTSAAAS